MLKTKGGIFLFNIIPAYRPGMSKVFDYGFYELACVPSIAQRCKQNTLYTSLENAAGESLADLDLFYVMATDGTRVFAAINWVDPGNFSFSEVNSPTFTENEGFTGNATNMYLNTGWAPDPDAINFTQDEGGAFCYVNNNPTQGTKTVFGCRGNAGNAGNGQTLLHPKLEVGGTDIHAFAVNATAPNVGSNVSAQGFFHIRRVASNDQRLFKDGSQVGATSALASTTLSTRDLAILACNYFTGLSTYSDHQVGCFGIGASLTGQESALYTAWNTYFTSI